LRPTETFARDALATTKRGGIERVLELPITGIQTDRRLLGQAGARLRLLVEPFGEVEEEEEGQLLGIGDRIGIAAAEQVVADVVDVLAELGGINL
jgi:hypothetical protein